MSTDTRPAPDRDWLDEVRTTLTDQLAEHRTRLTQLTADTGDPGEAYTQRALIGATRQSLDEIAGALERLAEGRYGICEECGGSIPRERLQILSHARFCVPCQRRRGN